MIDSHFFTLDWYQWFCIGTVNGMAGRGRIWLIEIKIQAGSEMCQAQVDGGTSGGSSVRRPESEDPHQHEKKFS